MRVLFSKRLPWVFLLIILLAFGSVYAYGTFFANSEAHGETTRVAYGNVSALVTVSGVVQANNSAKLAFPTNGVVKSVLAKEGERVTEGQILASLGQEVLTAEYHTALASLAFEEAARKELIEGPRNEARDVTGTAVSIAEQDLERIKTEQDKLVDNARRIVLSTDLEARPFNTESNDTPPSVTGTYTCEDKGSYIFTVYRSNTKSGYSYRLAGIETGTFTATVEHPSPLGTCGLYIQFNEDGHYANQDWVIEIPNTRSSTYLANQNVYELALKTQSNAVEAAEQAVELARNQQILENAKPRDEVLAQAESLVEQARAALAATEAQIADKTIRAPYDGIVTHVDIKVGEIGGQTKTITMIKDDSFEIKARIPEVDITKVFEGNESRITFDAKEDETLYGTVGFISPISTEIEGVAYYETNLNLNEQPEWMREGLNADVDIVIEKASNVLTIPSRFLIRKEDGYSVLLPSGKRSVERVVEVGLIGNDGYAEVIGLAEGTTVVAP
jgi:multidrug efflux pump subunit AcrA (membrane-fusion protein)